jgi:hypothetical protein
MKTGNKIFFTVLTAAAFCTAFSFGQQRYCDMALTLTSPTSGQFIGPFTHFDLKIRIKNAGPDNLLAGDTVYYNTSMDFSQTYHTFLLPQAISSGDSVEFLLENVANNNENPADEEENFCVKIKTNSSGPGPVDTMTGDNVSCNTVTFGGVAPPSGIRETQAAEMGFSIFPNPAKDRLYLNIDPAKLQSAGIAIRDISGRLIKEWEWKGSPEQVIDLSGFRQGIYLLSVQNDRQRSFLKFVKQ